MTNLESDDSIELSIVIPVKNEEGAISKLISEIEKCVRSSHEVIIVSDSQDGTNARVERLPRVRLFTPHKNDLAQSVAYGIARARGRYVCVMDGDGSHPPALITEMLEESERYDVIIGSRFRSEHTISAWPWHRRFISFVARMMAYPVLSTTDNMSGFFMLKTSLAQKTPIATKGYKVLLELTAYNRTCSVGEVGYLFRNRSQGTSKINAGVVLHFLRSLPRLYYLKFLRS